MEYRAFQCALEMVRHIADKRGINAYSPHFTLRRT